MSNKMQVNEKTGQKRKIQQFSVSNHFLKARDPFSSASHAIGAVFSVIGAVLLMLKAGRNGANLTSMISFGLFSLGLIGLYTASAVYHYSTHSKDRVRRLRKFDHSMIYALIAGTYTPVLLWSPPETSATFGLIPSGKEKVFVLVIWVIALLGMLLSLLWINAPRWLTTGIYIAMGWAILADVRIITTLPSAARILLFIGGVVYTLGGIMYWAKWPNISKKLSFHDMFHIFILTGSLCHFLMVYIFLT